MPLQRIAKKIAGDYNAKQLKAFAPLITQINTLYEERHALTDEQIQAKTGEFKERIATGASLDDLLPEAFATVKQAAKRLMGTKIEVKGDEMTWNMIHYDVQLIGGIVLHQSGIAEMRTGEGKTLVATLPCYLNALSGKGVHVVTVNDYLASRDAEWMGYLYSRLGLTVGSVTKQTGLDARRAEYEKDITYVENSELGFDYLRDNLSASMQERKMMWRPLNYALIDEVDSILIDEARTPMIISQPSEEATEKYEYYGKLITLLTPSKQKKKVKKGFLQELLKDVKKEEDEEGDDGGDYYIDEKTKSASLSSHGIEKLEKLLNIENLYKDLGYQEIHHIENALRAQACYAKDKEYLVRDGQILLVDDHTGRVMPGRRFSQGLHQALEAKENVQVQRESRTLASITYQHFFKQYKKLSGMTGTAVTEAEEFEKIYELEVLTIPTNKPILRVDKTDQVYFNQDAKWKAVVDYIKFYHSIGVPILIGTSSIQTSELVSSILTKMTLPHTVLNAKFHEQEANIVKNAGKKASVVVATNMAGRGTDIKLEDELFSHLATKYATWMKKSLATGGASGVVYSSLEYDLVIDALKAAFNFSDEDIQRAAKGGYIQDDMTFSLVFNTSKKTKEDAYAEIIIKTSTGQVEERDLHFGLFILGTEKHESRRIDNQLRGRAGRQGDPGVSQFFVAMDDEIMRKVGGDKIQSVARMMLSKEQLEEMVFTQKQFTSSIQRAQKQMEGRHFSSRKHLFDYDSVINKQRERIYAKRDQILRETDTSQEPILDKDVESDVIQLTVLDEIKASIDDIVGDLVKTYTAFKPWNLTELLEELSQITGAAFAEEEFSSVSHTSALQEKLTQLLHNLFDTKFTDIDEEKSLDLSRRVYLSVLDKNRQNHIDEMQYLREKVGLYGYAQLDPLVIYKKEAYDKFQRLLSTLKIETLAQIFRTDFVALIQGRQGQTVVPKKVSMEDVLRAVTEGLKVKRQPTKAVTIAAPQETIILEDGEEAVVLEDEGDVEVLELHDDIPTATDDVDTSQMKTKLRPNDKVSVRHTDGRIEHNVKYKKVKDMLDSGEVVLVS